MLSVYDEVDSEICVTGEKKRTRPSDIKKQQLSLQKQYVCCIGCAIIIV